MNLYRAAFPIVEAVFELFWEALSESVSGELPVLGELWLLSNERGCWLGVVFGASQPLGWTTRVRKMDGFSSPRASEHLNGLPCSFLLTFEIVNNCPSSLNLVRIFQWLWYSYYIQPFQLWSMKSKLSVSSYLIRWSFWLFTGIQASFLSPSFTSFETPHIAKSSSTCLLCGRMAYHMICSPWSRFSTRQCKRAIDPSATSTVWFWSLNWALPKQN